MPEMILTISLYKTPLWAPNLAHQICSVDSALETRVHQNLSVNCFFTFKYIFIEILVKISPKDLKMSISTQMYLDLLVKMFIYLFSQNLIHPIFIAVDPHSHKHSYTVHTLIPILSVPIFPHGALSSGHSVTMDTHTNLHTPLKLCCTWQHKAV